MRLAYVLGFYRDAAREQDICRGAWPRPDHTAFIRRNHVQLITYSEAAPDVAGALNEQGWLRLCPVSAAFGAGQEWDAVVASGEDVGVPLAIDAYAHEIDTPIYIVTHGFVIRHPAAMRLVRQMENVHFLCISESVRHIVLDRCGIPERRVHAIGWPVDTAFFHPVAAEHARSLVVSAGTANRDYSTLLRALSGLTVEANIAADSTRYPHQLDITPEQAPGGVTVGSCGSYLQLRRLYAQASFVVVPLYPAAYACGYVVMSEAMAMGKAVIATRTESVSDYLIDGETGYYVSPGDSDELRDKMSYLLANPDVARQLGERARRRIEQTSSLDDYARRLESIIGLTVAEGQGVSTT
jgi:glycosyltransferase involved in cell wall biosynthesis